MKHLTFGEKSLLVGDEVADLLLEYGAALARTGSADTVHVHGDGADGDEVVATFLLDQGATLMAETTHTTMDEPDNTEAVEYIRKGLKLLTSPPPIQPEENVDKSDFEHEFGL